MSTLNELFKKAVNMAVAYLNDGEELRVLYAVEFSKERAKFHMDYVNSEQQYRQLEFIVEQVIN